MRPGGTGDLTIGTPGNTADVDGTEDFDADGTVIIGSTAYVLSDVGSTTLRASVNVLQIDGTDSRLVLREDDSNYGYIIWDESENELRLETAGSGTSIRLMDDTYIRSGNDFRVYDSTNTDYVSSTHSGSNAILATNAGNIIMNPLNAVHIEHDSTQAVLGSNKALYIQADADGTPEDVFYVQWDGQIHADLGAGAGNVTVFDAEDDAALIDAMDMNDPSTWHAALHHEGKANLGNLLSLLIGQAQQQNQKIRHLEEKLNDQS
jgi:hypothetical protein